MQPGCLLCGRGLVQSEGIAPAGYYGETSDGRISGYLEEECFTDAVFQHFYSSRRELAASDPLRELFRESAQRSYFAFRRAPHTRHFFQQQLSFYRFDEEGLEVSHKTIELPAGSGAKAETGLLPLLEKILSDQEGRLGDEFLLIARVGSDFPEEILYEEEHRRFRRIADRIADQLLEKV